MLAILERDLLKYFRSTALIMVSLFLPLLQLVIIGNAVGGQVRNISVALVALDRGPETITLREKFAAIEANTRIFHIRLEDNLPNAVNSARDGRVAAVIVIPENYSSDLKHGNRPRLGLLLDNTDPFVVSTLTDRLHQLVDAVNQPEVQPRQLSNLALEIVELYPYISYVQYLLPGSITLAIFVSALIGGGLMYIDDKARGFHEGYLVTPISKTHLVVGMTVSGTIKAAFSGTVVSIAGTFIAGIGNYLTPNVIAMLLVMNVLISFSLTTMIGLIMVRVSDPLVPRAIFGILNTLLFFPSGAMYPIESFPAWLRVIAIADPFTYAVHGLRAILLKRVGLAAITEDMMILTAFAVICLCGSLVLFKRRL